MNIKKIVALCVSVSVLSSFASNRIAAFAQVATSSPSLGEGSLPVSSEEDLARQRLEEHIRAKAQELEKVNRELSETQKNLNETKAERTTLQKELTSIERNIGELNLKIKGDTITVEKLGLELQSLQFDIQDIKIAMREKKAAVAELVRSLQRNDDENLLFILFKNNSLAESVSEIQSAKNLNFQLAADIDNLKSLGDRLSLKIGDLSTKKGEIEVRKKSAETRRFIIQDQKQERQQLIVETKSKETLYAQQVNELRKRQQEIAEEIEEIERELRRGIDPTSLPIARSGLLGLPLEGIDRSLVTQDYGATDFAKSRYGYRGRWHNGIDFRASVGTPVFASSDGEVAAVGNQDAYCRKGAYGRFIAVNHPNNLTTLYAHLSRYIVQKGEQVKRGQVIGYSGQTGYATGPHLHFTVFAGPTFYIGPSTSCGPMPYGGDLNPLNYL